jgi:hypothetical protein
MTKPKYVSNFNYFSLWFDTLFGLLDCDMDMKKQINMFIFMSMKCILIKIKFDIDINTMNY